MLRATVLLLVACVCLAAAQKSGKSGKSGGKSGGTGDKRGWFWRPKPRPKPDPSKLFFCGVTKGVCSLAKETGDSLETVFTRECPGAECSEGDSGAINYQGTDYVITFCPWPADDADPYDMLIAGATWLPAVEAIKDLCPSPIASFINKFRKKPLWYYLACRVDGDEEGDVKAEKPCDKYGDDVTCSQGPYDAPLAGADVEAFFCNTTIPPVPPKPEELEPAWYYSACYAEDIDSNVVVERTCRRNQNCTERILDLDYNDTLVTVSFCDYGRLGLDGPHGKGSIPMKPSKQGRGKPDRG